MQQQLPSASASDTGHRGRGRPQQPPVLALTNRPDPLREHRCRRCCFAGGISRQSQQTSATEGHQTSFLAEGHFLREKRFIPTIHQVLNHRMLWGVGLHQHLPRSLTSPGTARQLQQQLQGLLSCAEIGAVQKPIRREHCRQGDPRQIHALGQHLRADQDVGLSGSETVQQASMAIPPPGGIAVKAEQTKAFELLREQFQHLLRPGPKRLEGRGTTVTATVLQVFTMVTPVATQPLTPGLAAVNGERHIAVGAHHHLAATAAAQKGAVSPTRHQNHGLFALLRQRRKTIHQGATDQTLVSFGQLMAHVDHMHRR